MVPVPEPKGNTCVKWAIPHCSPKVAGLVLGSLPRGKYVHGKYKYISIQ